MIPQQQEETSTPKLPVPTYCLQQAIPRVTLVLFQGTTKQDRASFKWESGDFSVFLIYEKKIPLLFLLP